MNSCKIFTILLSIAAGLTAAQQQQDGLYYYNQVPQQHYGPAQSQPPYHPHPQPEMRSPCNIGDPLGCLKMKAWGFISSFFNKDTLSKIPNFMEINRNTYVNQHMLRSNGDVEDTLGNFIKSHTFKLNVPLIGSEVVLDGKNLDDGEVDFKVHMTGEGRKSKLKKLAIPILIFVLLKAIVFIPVGLGLVGLKAFNALQLSFVAFVATIGLAVYQLCTKLTEDHAPPVAAHVAWEPYRQKRDLQVAQRKAYRGYR